MSFADNASGTYETDPVIEFYKRDVDRGLLRQALKMTPHERLVELQRLNEAAEQLRLAGEKAKSSQ